MFGAKTNSNTNILTTKIYSEMFSVKLWPYCPYLGWLTHCGLMTPYGDKDLGQHWLRQWLVAWRHQAITWTNVDLPSVRSIGIHLSTILQEILQPSITKISWKITSLKFLWNLPGANELKSLESLHLSKLGVMSGSLAQCHPCMASCPGGGGGGYSLYFG